MSSCKAARRWDQRLSGNTRPIDYVTGDLRTVGGAVATLWDLFWRLFSSLPELCRFWVLRGHKNIRCEIPIGGVSSALMWRRRTSERLRLFERARTVGFQSFYNAFKEPSLTTFCACRQQLPNSKWRRINEGQYFGGYCLLKSLTLISVGSIWF